MISVIIPAHNEEAVIDRCLTALLDGAPAGAMEVLVVCNGCDDGTAELARSHGGPVHVIEISVASKVAALNAGDAAAKDFPRCYIDADVVVGWDAVEKIGSTLQPGKALVAAPRVQFDLQHCNWFVKSFYRVWETIPYFVDGMVGTGFYALSEEGRSRFDTFPGITSDDGYVRSLFSSAERTVVETCRFTVFPPRTLMGIIKIKTRARFGTLEQRVSHPGQGDGTSVSWRGTLVSLCLSPVMWPRAFVYVTVVCVARLRARWRFLFGDHHKWDRDDTARQGGVR